MPKRGVTLFPHSKFESWFLCLLLNLLQRLCIDHSSCLEWWWCSWCKASSRVEGKFQGWLVPPSLGGKAKFFLLTWPGWRVFPLCWPLAFLPCGVVKFALVTIPFYLIRVASKGHSVSKLFWRLGFYLRLVFSFECVRRAPVFYPLQIHPPLLSGSGPWSFVEVSEWEEEIYARSISFSRDRPPFFSTGLCFVLGNEAEENPSRDGSSPIRRFLHGVRMWGLALL